MVNPLSGFLLLLFLFLQETQSQTLISLSPLIHVVGTKPTLIADAVTSSTWFAVAFSQSDCSTSEPLLAVTSFFSTNQAVFSDVPSLTAAGEYSVCQSFDNVTWTAPGFTFIAIVASETLLQDLIPYGANVGSYPTLTTDSQVQTQYSVLGFSLYNCVGNTVNGRTNVTTTTFQLESTITFAGVYAVCFSVDSGKTFLPQSGLTFTFQTVPSAPQSFQLLNYTPSSANFSWTAPSFTGYANLGGYTITLVDPKNETAASIQVSPDTFNYVVPNLIAKTTYTCYLAAFNGAGQSPELEITVTTKAPTPPGPVPSMSAQTNSVSMSLTWSPPVETGGNGTLVYYLEIFDTLFGNETTATTNQTALSLFNLPSNTMFNISISAANSIGTGSTATFSFSTTVGSPPTSPQDLEVVSITATSVSFQWNPSTAASDVPITQYTIYYGISAPFSTTKVSPNINSGLLSNLKSGETYTIYVTAVNAIGESAPSNEITPLVTGPSLAAQILAWFNASPWNIVAVAVGGVAAIIVLTVAIHFTVRKIRQKREEKIYDSTGLNDIDSYADMR